MSLFLHRQIFYHRSADRTRNNAETKREQQKEKHAARQALADYLHRSSQAIGKWETGATAAVAPVFCF